VSRYWQVPPAQVAEQHSVPPMQGKPAALQLVQMPLVHVAVPPPQH
jgi:hypothetical protein